MPAPDLREEKYAERAPRYADLSLEEWAAQTSTFPIDQRQGCSSCSWQSWLSFTCIFVFIAYDMAWGLMAVISGAEGLYILSANITHTPSIAVHDGRQYAVSHGQAMLALVSYSERVWLSNASAAGSSDAEPLHYLASSTISSSCHYTVYSNVTRLRIPITIYNDYRPDGDESALSFPGCAAFMTVRVSFLLFFITQLAYYFVFALGSASLAQLGCARAVFQRDYVSDGQEPVSSSGGWVRRMALSWAGLDPSTLRRAPMPSQQRMAQHHAAQQKARLHNLHRWWKAAAIVLSFPCVFAFISLAAIVAFVRTAGFVDAERGPLFAVHVAGCVAYLTLMPLALWASRGMLSEETRQMQAIGMDADADVEAPTVPLTTASSGLLSEPLHYNSSSGDVGPAVTAASRSPYQYPGYDFSRMPAFLRALVDVNALQQRSGARPASAS